MRHHPLALAALVPAVLLAAGCGPSAPAGGGADAGTTYGAPLAEAVSMSVADVVARAAELEGKTVRVEGTVADVCAKRGCWIKLAEETGPASVVFKVEDGVMVFPMDAKGSWAVADGVLKQAKLSLEKTRERLAHEAGEAGRPFDPASVTEGMTLVRIDGVGARIRARR